MGTKAAIEFTIVLDDPETKFKYNFGWNVNMLMRHLLKRILQKKHKNYKNITTYILGIDEKLIQIRFKISNKKPAKSVSDTPLDNIL